MSCACGGCREAGGVLGVVWGAAESRGGCECGGARHLWCGVWVCVWVGVGRPCVRAGQETGKAATKTSNQEFMGTRGETQHSNEE